MVCICILGQCSEYGSVQVVAMTVQNIYCCFSVSLLDFTFVCILSGSFFLLVLGLDYLVLRPSLLFCWP
jgi:hypothetical protein